MSYQINMIGLFPQNMEKMVLFYRDVLGLTTDWDGKSPYAEFTGAGIRFAMYSRTLLPGLLAQTPQYTPLNGVNGTFELAIDLPFFEDVDPEYQRVLKLGARPVYAPRDEPWGMRSSMVTDPEGNLIEIGSWNKGNR